MSKDYKVDIFDLVEAVREVALEHPNHVYGYSGYGCAYTHADGSMGCIIGTAMAKLGKPLPTQAEAETEFEGQLVTNVVGGGAWMKIFGIDDAAGDQAKALWWLGRVQARQDTKTCTWREAVAYADRGQHLITSP